MLQKKQRDQKNIHIPIEECSFHMSVWIIYIIDQLILN